MALRFTLRQLEYFIAAGECGSIAAASEKLNVSSPSISASISQLEAEFGLSLFVRKRAHGLTLTEAGIRLMEQSAKVLLASSELSSLAGEISGNVQGPLRLGCLLTFAQILAPRLRREFEAEYPAVTIKQYELNQVDIFSRIRRAELDVALTYELDIPLDLQFVPLLGLSPYVLVSPEHPLAELTEIRVEQLKDQAMILLDLPHSSEYFLSFFKSQGQRAKIAERTHDMAVMRSLVANGFGYSIANIRPLNDESPDGGKLKLIPLVGDVRPLNMGLLMAKGADTSITVRAFTSHCEDMIREKRLPGLT
ncbi:LysR family transcriptional regulator [Roseovarius sp. EL26]|uniref:LysR family transcriptional regulator n=1 Tax=Roseovarius sp. EL26 TaxID=2126672 RepID=UPI000EA113EF|nr:LysR family transcriptional regulator [Roseovarius sp. EL26]